MNTFEYIEQEVLKMCEEYDILIEVDTQGLLQADLIESGIIDSTGLITMQGAIEEQFQLHIPSELFAGELRNIHSIAVYIAKNGKRR